MNDYKIITINHKKELRCLINQIKRYGLDTDGILFGGIVRDDIIGNHYRNLFIEKSLDFNNYWNDKYDLETRYRTIIPNDIDIFFKKVNSSIMFQDKISNFIRDFPGSTMSVSIENTFKNINYTNNNLFLTHKKINIRLIIGNTLTCRGKTLNLKIDVIEIDHLRSSAFGIDIEPPFYNVDFLSNVFIVEKVNSSYITRISNCTGTDIDCMVFSKKAQITAKIIDDIINLRTQFINRLISFNAEYINCYRILKMIDRDYFSWNITNVPFEFIETLKIKDSIEDKCCICLDDIIVNNDNKIEIAKKFEKIVMLTTNVKKVNYLHVDCFMNYLKKEQRNRFIDDTTGKIECRCPFRNLFKFKECYKKVEYI